MQRSARLQFAAIGPEKYPGADNFAFHMSFNYLEYQYLIFDIESIIFGEGRGYGNLAIPQQSDLELLQRVAQTRLKNLVEFLRLGRTVIAIAAPIPANGQSSAQFVQTLNVFQGYPWEKMKVRKMTGSTADDLKNPSDEHLARFLELTSYTYTILEPNGDSLAFATGTKEPICLLQDFEGGQIVYVQKPRDKREREDWQSRAGAFVAFLSAFLETLEGRAKASQAAAWTSHFFTEESYAHLIRQRDISKSISLLTVELNSATAAAEELSWFRQLLGGTGQPLEVAAKRALEVLGIKIEVLPSKEHADIVARWEDQILAIEVKGISGNLRREHIRQAIEWKHKAERNLETDDTQVSVRGLVIVVPHREKQVSERPKESIHANEIASAESNEIGIIAGEQLLAALHIAKASPNARESVVRTLFTESGLITFTDDPMSVLIKDE